MKKKIQVDGQRDEIPEAHIFMSATIRKFMKANPYYFECSIFFPVSNPMVE